MSVTIKTSYQEHEARPANIAKDAMWISQNRVALYEQYGDCVLLIYHEQVIGKGESVPEAIADAESRMQDETGVITPIVKYLSSPYRIGVLREKKDRYLSFS
jgi:hypothetical protein